MWGWKYEERAFGWGETCQKDIPERGKGYVNMLKRGLWQQRWNVPRARLDLEVDTSPFAVGRVNRIQGQGTG